MVRTKKDNQHRRQFQERDLRTHSGRLVMHLFGNNAVLFTVALVAAACTGKNDDANMRTAGEQSELTSVEAVFYNFEWDGSLVRSSTNINNSIEQHIRWTVGQLNGNNSIGRLDNTEVSEVEVADGGINYHAKMVVAWGEHEVPASYALRLPKRVDYQFLNNFIEKYAETCMDDPGEDHDLTPDNGWYYYRPELQNCELDPEDSVIMEASLTENSEMTTNKFPEYHKVWEDNTLRVVAIFGKVEEDGDENDGGYRGFNRFVYRISRLLRNYDLLTIPPDLKVSGFSTPSVPAPEVTDAELRGYLPGDRRVVVNAFVVPSLSSAGKDFFDKYESLSAAADFIAYNGHADLGNNVSLLARKGKWVRDQWVAVMMNGCDTFAYIDPALTKAHMEVNPDDRNGTAYLDLFNNAMPVMFTVTAPDTMAVIDGLISYNSPMSYEQILRNFSSSQVALVSGEEDNVYKPGYVGKQWTVEYGIATVAPKTWKHYGPFRVDSDGLIKVYTSGLYDADLYVKKGSQASDSRYDCKSESPYANEQCVLKGAGEYHVAVFSWEPNNDTTFDITVTYNGTDVDIDTDTDTDTDNGADADADSDAVTDADADTDSDAESDADTNADTDADSDADGATDQEETPGGDSDGDGDGDNDEDRAPDGNDDETEANTDLETGGQSNPGSDDPAELMMTPAGCGCENAGRISRRSFWVLSNLF